MVSGRLGHRRSDPVFRAYGTRPAYQEHLAVVSLRSQDGKVKNETLGNFSHLLDAHSST